MIAVCKSFRTRFQRSVFVVSIAVVILVTSSTGAIAQSAEPPSEPPSVWAPISSTMEEIPYPHSVQYFDIHSFGKDLKLAYMDVKPQGSPNGQTAMLFHGMNFTGKAFEVTIDALTADGFRVIVPDRIGYGRSSKPDIPYNLHVFTSNAKALLDHLEIPEVAIVGHSMGGMVATRFAMSYPDTTTHVVMANQIGMTDQRQSRTWRDIEDVYRGVLGTSYQSILRNHMRYYPTWKPEYLDWVRLQYGLTLTSEWPLLARIRAWQTQILFFDPVVYDWQHIGTKALVIGGAADALTRDYASAARHVAETLPNAELVLFPGIGHNPHFEIPDEFHRELIRFLRSDPNEPAKSNW